MAKSKVLRVDGDFDDFLNRQLEKLKEDCLLLGIRPREIPKARATKLLVKKLMEMENEKKVNFKLL